MTRLPTKQAGQSMTQYIIILALVAVSAVTLFSAFGGVNRAQVSAVANEIAGNHQGAKDSIQLAQNYARYASDSASYSRDMGNYSSSPSWSNYSGGGSSSGGSSSGGSSSGGSSSGGSSSGGSSSGSSSSGGSSSGGSSSGGSSSGGSSSGGSSSGGSSSGGSSSGGSSSGSSSSGGSSSGGSSSGGADPEVVSCGEEKKGFSVLARKAKTISPIDDGTNNGQVCTIKLTEQDKRNIAMMADLQPFVNSGDYIGFWNKAKEYNDPLAQLALEFHGSLYGDTLPTRIAVSKLELAYTGGDSRLPPDELAQLKAVVGKGLMIKHYETLKNDIDNSIGIPGVLSVFQIDNYHYEYFGEIGLPPRTYGGWFVPGALYCASCDPVSE